MPLREVRYDDLQVWITGLSANGSVRFERKGLSASRVRQAHQLVGAVLKFASRCAPSTSQPTRAEGMDLPRLPETEQRYLSHDQLHRVAVASGRLRTLVLLLGYCGLRFGEAAALHVSDVDVAGSQDSGPAIGDVCPQDRSGRGSDEEPQQPDGAGP
jgi:integrase